MARERTFSMLKPGVVQRRLAGEILARIERKGLRIIALKMMKIDRKLAETHYGEHRDKPFFGELVDFIISGPVVAMVVEGDGAVSVLRKLCGATKAEEALPGTIRGDYAEHTGLNIIHASDSVQSAEREIGLFFRLEELFDWEDGNDGWI
ncbi:MAG TPA: nucleoside-diphosphate kinase [Rectinemataceae bacterium]|nr:nucleoside-diphosphate kinase [Rectinemataceae bacterium]